MSDRLDPRQILLLIDPQNDFHGGGTLGMLSIYTYLGTLSLSKWTQQRFLFNTICIAVPGADEDAGRIATLINEKGGNFDEIIVTLDSHYKIHIAHGEYA